MEAIDSIFKFVGGVVVAGGGLSLLVYQIFKKFSVKWLDSKFDQRLQELKHEQQKDLEQMKYKISALLDRSVKLHQREFDVLPEAWSKINDAYWYVRSFVSALQSYPDVDRMGAAQQEEFIKNCQLQEWQKEELRKEQDKTGYYQKEIYWYKSSQADQKSRDAYTYLIKNGIFINEGLRGKLSEIHDIFWEALAEHQTNEEYGVRPRSDKKIEKLNKEGDGLMKALEREIHERLWPSSSGL